MSDELIKSFLVGIGFAADESSARKTEERIKRVEATARTADQARTKTSNEQAMERARIALKAAGVENATMAQIMAKRDQMAKAEEGHEKRRAQYEARQAKAQANAVAGMRTLVNVAAATAVAVQSVTIAVAGYATHVAGKLEEMAYSSDRTKSSIQDLKVFSQAVSQLGGTAGGALNDLEAFGERLRANPQGYTAFLKSVGVEARDAQGNIRGAAELYKEFRKQVGQKPYEQQLLYAQEMGVSEQTWRATDPAKLAVEEARSRAKYARMGYDPDKAAEGAKNLQHALRDMFESVNIIGEKTASKIFADVGDNLKSLTTFIEQHGDQIADILSKVTQLVLGFTRALLEMATSDKVKGFLDGLLSMFGNVDTATGKWVADTDKIQTALEALATFVATIFVAKIVGGIRDVMKELKPLLALLAPFAAALGLPVLGTAVVGGALIGGSDPSKGLTHGGRPDGALNPGDELPGAGGGSGSEGEGAWARAKRLGRAALGAIGLGGGKSGGSMPGIPDTVQMTPSERNTLGLIMKYESHGQNTMNYVGKGQGLDPQTPKGYTAQGYFQMLNSNWRRIAPQLGITAPNAMAGSLEDQTRVALHLLRNGGIQNWSNYNPGLRAALARGEKAPAGSVPNVAPNLAPSSPPATAPGSAPFPAVTPNAQGAVEKFNDTMKRLDTGKLRAFGAATQGFDPSQYFNAPPAGASSTSNDNSVKKQSYRGGDTHVTINTHGDVRETADMWRRHGERQKADDVRYAASVFA